MNVKRQCVRSESENLPLTSTFEYCYREFIMCLKRVWDARRPTVCQRAI